MDERVPHQFHPVTEVCVWCGFGRAEITDFAPCLGQCTVPPMKRGHREVIELRAHGEVVKYLTPPYGPTC